MAERTRIELGRRADLGADCARCFGLCCVALAFAKSADFPFDKAAGDPCENLDGTNACLIHPELRRRGFTGCTVFDCFGAGQKVSQGTFEGRSWRDDPHTRAAMFDSFPIVRRLHELLWYLDEAITLVGPERVAAALLAAFDRVRRLSDGTPTELAALDVDAEYNAARTLLIEASSIARRGIERPRSPLRPGSELSGARLAGADLRGVSLRGSIAIAADLRGARMRRCDLLGVDLRGADLSGADLEGAIYLTQMQVNSARGDERTVLPGGLERPPHWVRPGGRAG